MKQRRRGKEEGKGAKEKLERESCESRDARGIDSDEEGSKAPDKRWTLEVRLEEDARKRRVIKEKLAAKRDARIN